MASPPTVLVTGVGAVIGYGILRSLRAGDEVVRLVGMDTHEDAYGRLLADAFEEAVPAADPGYVAFIRRLVPTHGIDLIIPGIEQDLYALWRHRDQVPARIVLNNDRCLELSQSKLETFRFFSRLGARFVIPTLSGCSYVESVARLGLPFVLKPDFSYAGKGMAIIRSARDFDCAVGGLGGRRFVCQRLVGTDDDEYTVSVFGDGRGGYADAIVLRRRLSPEGATAKAVYADAEDAITEAVDAICRELEPVGPTNIQLRKEAGRAYLLEINPRISSACSIRTLMGYNEPAMCVRYYLWGELPEPARKRGGRVTRFIDDGLIDG